MCVCTCKVQREDYGLSFLCTVFVVVAVIVCLLVQEFLPDLALGK